jgi:phage terminase large subunit
MTVALEGDLVHAFEPRGTIRQALESRASEILVAGPAGTGKSYGLLQKMHAVLCKYPGSKGLAMRKTAVSLASTGLQTFENHVVPQFLERGLVNFFGGSRREPPAYRYWNGSRLVVGGMDNPMKIMSSDYDMVYVQEANELDEDEWEKATTRLRNGKMPYQQLLADCNPQEPTHWLKVRADRGGCVYLHSTHEENPLLFDLLPDGTYQVTEFGAQYMAKLDALTGVRYKRLRKGLWVAAEGVIFEQWDPQVHLVHRYDIPPEWPRFWVVDFGYVNPMVVQMWAEKPDGELVMYREFYHTNKTVDEMARMVMESVAAVDPSWAPDQRSVRQQLRDRSEGMALAAIPPSAWRWHEPKPQFVVCDHDAEGRAVWSRETGLVTRAAKKDVLDGIQEVQVRLRDGRMTIMRDSLAHPIDQALADVKKPVSTVEEFPGYVWDTGAGKKIKEAPLKENDHGMDCCRYLAMARSVRFRPGFRST